MFEYAILVTLYWAAFYALYAVVLRRHTFFQLNRLYLLGALAAGMVLPLLKDINLQWGAKEEPVFYAAPVVEGFEFIYNLEAVVIAPTPASAAFPWKTVLAAVYLLGAGLCLFRFFVGLYKLWRLRAGSELVRVQGSRVAYTKEAHLPFSFGRTIFLSKKTPWTPEEEAGIISHERAHIRDGHTMDVLALELLGVVFWFSPPLYLYRRSLRLLHEYIADAIVLRTRARRDYGRLLIRQALPGLHPHIAHSFHSSLKQRIAMMTKTQSNPGARWLYLAAAPLAFGLVLLFSQRSAIAAALPELSSLMSFVEEVDQSPLIQAPAPATASPGNDSDVPPVFEGCENEPAEARQACSQKKFLQLIIQRLHYPDEARRSRITGTVTANYTVDAKGALTGISIVEDIGGGCGEEVVRVLQKMAAISKWTPGMKEGKPVATTLTLPVQFAWLELDEAYTSDNDVGFASGMNALKTSFQGTAKVLTWDTPQKGDVFFINNRLVSESEFQRIKQGLDIFDLIEVYPRSDDEGPGSKTYMVISKTKPESTAQASNEAASTEEIFKVVEEMPRFPGCEDAALPVAEKKPCADKRMLEFIYENIRYPAKARDAGVEGTVVVSFIVEKDGAITNPQVVRSIGGGCDEETLRVINMMPRWIAGRQRGRDVRVQYNLPVRFKLEGASPMSGDVEDKVTPPPLIIEGKGLTSLTGDDEKPLIYVNGTRIPEGDIRLVSPDQIEKIEAFRGDKAIAFAGPEGKDGVVLITLKPNAGKNAAPATASGSPGVYKVVEEMPRFPGCEDASLKIVEKKNCADRKMLEFIYQNLRYPALARENGIEGTVVISYIVDTDGSLKDIKAVRGIGGGCEEEVVRIVNLMPRWIPGRQKGEAVAVQFNLPVRFKLDAETPANAAPAGSRALKVEDFKLFPNPSDGKFTLQFKAPEKPTLIQVRDMQGRVVFTRNLSTFSGTFREELNLGKSPKGDYVVVISQGEAVFTANYIKL